MDEWGHEMSSYKGHTLLKYQHCNGVIQYAEFSPNRLAPTTKLIIDAGRAEFEHHPRIIDTRFGVVTFQYSDYREYNRCHEQDFDWAISLFDKYRKFLKVRKRMGV